MVLNGCENRSLAKESLLIMASPENPHLEGCEETKSEKSNKSNRKPHICDRHFSAAAI